MKGPAKRTINSWKKKYEHIYKVIFENKNKDYSQLFIFRVPGREEWKQITFIYRENPMKLQEKMCSVCTLYPKNFDFENGLAGYAEVLNNIILRIGGYQEGQAKEALDAFRQELEFQDYQSDCLIHEAFPEYSIEEIQKWTNLKLTYYLSRAEFILKQLRGVQIIIEGSEEAKQIQAQQQQGSQQKTYQHNFKMNDVNSPLLHAKKPQKSKKNPKEQSQTIRNEEDLLKKLAENEAIHGRKIAPPSTHFDELDRQEANYDVIHDRLKGDFD